MQLTFLLALVLAFSSLLNADGQLVTAPDVRLAWAALACASLIGFAWWIGQMKCHVESAFGDGWWPWIRRAERLHKFAYLAAMLMVFIVCDFAAIVRNNWQLGRFLLADDLVIAVPLVMPLVLSWFLLAAPGSMGKDRDADSNRLRYVWLQTRHLIALPMIPVFAMTGIADSRRLLLHTGSDEAACGFFGPLAVVAIAISLPWLLRYCWQTSPLEPGPARSLIEGTLAEAGVSVRQILRWETHGQLANAAVTGFVPPLRYLFVTDELLRRLSPLDLQMITAHEAAHCRFGHLPRLAASLAIPFFALVLGSPILSRLSGSVPNSTPLLVMAVLGLWSLWHGRWARLLEHQADLAACRLVSAGQSRLSVESVEAFERALRATGTGTAGDWLHPSPAARIALLHRLANQPKAESGFQRRVQTTARWQWLIIALLAGVWIFTV